MVNQVSLDINSMVVSIHRKLQRHGVVVVGGLKVNELDKQI